ncbi:MAG: SDR family oxidoreductase, partial [Proteobacteria bacterium]|nr:SDR family oxidoreductase [Pseudomonadota bacterium]
MNRDVLLTGATGFLGKVVLHELVRRRESLAVDRVRVLVRTDGSGSAEQRFANDVASSPCFAGVDPSWQERVEPVACELSEPGAGIEGGRRESLQRSVSHIINCAASVQFDLPLGKAAKSNVTTALEMLDFAQGCRNLDRFVSVSTAYVTPHDDDRQPVFEELAG